MALYQTRQGDMIDAIVVKHYGANAQTQRIVERVLEANPGLASQGVTLPQGLVITLPDLDPAPASQPVRLWD